MSLRVAQAVLSSKIIVIEPYSVPAKVPISVKTSEPQLLTGPKPRRLDRRDVSVSVCCSEHGSTVSLRNKAATLIDTNTQGFWWEFYCFYLWKLISCLP